MDRDGALVALQQFMRRARIAFLALSIGGMAACGGTFEPSGLYPSYFLSQLDGEFLPAPYGADGSLLVAGSLGFGRDGRPRSEGPRSGMVKYSQTIRLPDQSEQRSSIDLEYTIADGVFRINLCPPLALCITTTELIGPILWPTEELVLTHYVGGMPGSVFRYFPTLPE